MRRKETCHAALRRRLVTAAVATALGLGAAGQARAWNVEVGTSTFENNLYFESWSGPPGPVPTITLLAEGVHADHSAGGIPLNYNAQAWEDGWPQGAFTAEDDFNGVYSYATVVQEGGDLEDHTDDPYPDSSYAYVYGDIAPGYAHGASWYWDVLIEIPAFTSATLVLNGSETYVSMESEAGDDGIAFGDVKLYDPNVDLDDPFGVNNPYDGDYRSLSSPPTGGLLDDNLELSYTFNNTTSSVLSYTLRVEGSVGIFESAVPEPATLSLLALGSMLGLRRPRRG